MGYLKCLWARSDPLIIIGMGLRTLVTCDGTQTVTLMAEDFRFVPELVRVQASSPLTLTVYNAGLEIHKFESSIFMYSAETSSQETSMKLASPGIILEPWKSVQLVMAPPL